MAKSKRRYGFKAGAHVKGDPNAIGNELERIRAEKGSLTAECVVEEAQRKSSPLHDQFQWDDASASREYRLIQARKLLRVIVVVIDGGRPAQQYVHVRTGEKQNRGTYEPVDVVIDDPDMYQSALELLEVKLTAAVSAVQELREAAGKANRKGQLAVIGIVMKALETASSAVKKLAA